MFAGLAAVLVALPLSVRADSLLTGEQLRETIAGRTVTLDTPLGGLPISYAADGTMRAQGAQPRAVYRQPGRQWHVVARAREAVPALAHLVGRQGAVLHSAPRRRDDPLAGL